MISRALQEAFYRKYMEYFEHAERRRRWSVFDDPRWDQLDRQKVTERAAICAETFCAVEMYLPDYLQGHLDVLRGNFGRAWFAANWGYEESKHSLALREYLVRSGKRTEQQMFDFEAQILGRRWVKPFETPRQMTIYGAVQERTTFVIYKKQEATAASEGEGVLEGIYALIARDEMAHTRFYEDIVAMHLAEDREGTLEDLAYVLKNFRMPAEHLVPDYSSRVEVMRSAGIDRSVFLTEVWAPLLKRLKLTRQDLPPLWRVRADAPARLSEGGDSMFHYRSSETTAG